MCVCVHTRVHEHISCETEYHFTLQAGLELTEFSSLSLLSVGITDTNPVTQLQVLKLASIQDSVVPVWWQVESLI